MTEAPNVARIRVAIAGTKPAIWRRVEVPLAISLSELHEVIQAVMPWEDCHLFQFEIGSARYGIPDPELDFGPDILDASATRLANLLAEGISKFVYVYDLGDDWRHEITVEKLGNAATRAKYPLFLEGVGRAPPEDVGGIGGFYDFVKVMTKGAGRVRQEMIDWYGDVFDPANIDAEQIKLNLAEIARLIPAGNTKRR